MAKVATGGQQRAPDPSDWQGEPDAGDDQEEPAVVDLSELVSDPNGEVVLFNDSGLRALAVSTNAAVVDRGKAGRHVTAAGEDVSGFRYLAFDNGLKLFHDPELELIVVPTPA